MRPVPASAPVPVAAQLVLFDACTLQNFAVVDALWVLKCRYGGRAGWTEGVRHEIRRGLRTEPLLQRVLDLENGWLGNPLCLDEPGDYEDVDLIRRGLGGTSAEPLKHLGEAESIHALERADAHDRVFVTDDGPAADFVRRRPGGLRVLDAASVLAEAYAYGELRCPQAYELLTAMWKYPREIRVPPHREVC
jgi:hypothetical protein